MAWLRCAWVSLWRILDARIRMLYRNLPHRFAFGRHCDSRKTPHIPFIYHTHTLSIQHISSRAEHSTAQREKTERSGAEKGASVFTTVSKCCVCCNLAIEYVIYGYELGMCVIWMCVCCLCAVSDRNDKALRRRAMDNVHGECVWRLLICVRSKQRKKTKKRIAWSKCAPDVDAGMLHSALLCFALLCYAVHHVLLLLLLPARCPISNISTDVIAIGSSVVVDDWMLYLLFCVHHHHQTLTELLRCPGRVLVHSNFRNIDASQCACSTARYLVCDTLRKMLRAILLWNWI